MRVSVSRGRKGVLRKQKRGLSQETLPWGSNDQTENPKEQWDESYYRDNLETTPIYKKDKSFTNVGTLLLVWQDNVFEMLTNMFSLYPFSPFYPSPPAHPRAARLAWICFVGRREALRHSKGKIKQPSRFILDFGVSKRPGIRWNKENLGYSCLERNREEKNKDPSHSSI